MEQQQYHVVQMGLELVGYAPPMHHVDSPTHGPPKPNLTPPTQAPFGLHDTAGELCQGVTSQPFVSISLKPTIYKQPQMCLA